MAIPSRNLGWRSRQVKLSIVMPCYNEIGTIETIIDLVLGVDLPVERELIVVDDCSTDGTRDVLERYRDRSEMRVVTHDVNRGKGAALRTGFQHATGEIVLVQDADLEYDPIEYERLLRPILEGKAQVVYGSRFRGGETHRVLYFWHSLGNRFLTLLSNMFTNLNLTDMEVCYKVFTKDVLDRIELTEDRFGFEPEVTAKVARLGCPIYAVYYPHLHSGGEMW